MDNTTGTCRGGFETRPYATGQRLDGSTDLLYYGARYYDPAKYGSLVNRKGTSMADLRLSVRGWRLGRTVATGGIQTNKGLANWIALNVAGD